MRLRAVSGMAVWGKHADDPVEALAGLTRDPEPAVRQAAAAALGRPAAQSDTALDHLRASLESHFTLVRAGAAAAFGHLLRTRTDEALAALSLLTRDEDPRVRAAALGALALSPRRAADRALGLTAEFIQRPADSTQPSGEGEALSRTLSVLARYRPKRALEQVRMAARHPSEVCRWFAALALGGRWLAGQRGARALAEAFARDPANGPRRCIAQALRRAARWAPAPWQMALARRLLKDDHRLVRANAAEAIGPLAAAFPAEGIPLLSALARDDDAYLRMGAAQAAADAASADPAWALYALAGLAWDRDSGVRQATAAAMGALARSHANEAAPVILALIADREAHVRAASVRAAEGLLHTHAAQTVEALAARAADVHPQVRRAALEVLYAAAELAPEPCAQAALAALADEALHDLAVAVLARAAGARPERTLDWLFDGLQAADLRFLDAFASCHQDEDAAALAVGLKEVATAPDLPAAVERMAERIQASGPLCGGEARAGMWGIVGRYLRVRALPELEAMIPMIARFSELAKQYGLDMAQNFERISVGAQLVLRARAARRIEDRLRNLQAAKAIADQMLGEPAPWSDPARLRMWREVLLVSAGVLGAAAAAARAAAAVEARWVSKQAVRRQRVPLLVELHNAGAGAARALRVEVEPGSGYRSAGASPTLAMLYPGERRHLEVPVGVEPGPSRLHVVGKVTYADEAGAARRSVFRGDVVLLDPAKPFRPIENPYLPGKPLEPGSPMFFGRKPMFRFLKSALGGATQSNVVVLTGQRRIGKTSLLKQIGPALGDEFFPVFIDVQGLLVDTVPLFLYQLAWHTTRSLREVAEVREPPPADDFARSPGLIQDQLSQAVTTAGGRQLVLLLDEFDDLDYKVTTGLLPPMVFDHLRHIMQHVPNCAFVLSGTHRIEELAGDYWSFLFNLALHRAVGPLTHEDALRLVQKPMAQAGVVCEDLAAINLCNLTGGHPYLTQLACHMLVEQCGEERRLVITTDHGDEMGEELLRWGEPHLRYWWDTASPEERAVLAVAAEDTELAEAVAAEGVARRLSEVGVALETTALASAIERLHGKALLGHRGPGSGVARICTGLAGRWVRAHWPLARVAHALRAGEWGPDNRSAP